MVRLMDDGASYRTYYGMGGGDQMYKNLKGQEWDFDIRDCRDTHNTTRYQGQFPFLLYKKI